MSVSLIVFLSSVGALGILLIVNGIYGITRRRKNADIKQGTSCSTSTNTEDTPNVEKQIIEMSFVLPIENSDHKKETKIKTKKSSKAKKAKKSK